MQKQSLITVTQLTVQGYEQPEQIMHKNKQAKKKLKKIKEITLHQVPEQRVQGPGLGSWVPNRGPGGPDWGARPPIGGLEGRIGELGPQSGSLEGRIGELGPQSEGIGVLEGRIGELGP